ncbi:hypothetical protein [Streptomyces sp. NPDC054794]
MANRATAAGRETFHLIKNGDGTVSLVACNNLYVTSNNGQTPLITDRTAKGS